jgi:ribosomal protein S18 acetylase RimI-like enzyme
MGYEPVRVHYWMTVTLKNAPPSPQWPEGIAVRAYVPGQDEQALYEAGEASFQDIWNRQPSTLERWTAATRDPDFDPSLWFLAQDQATGAVAAICLCSAIPGQGMVTQLGVLRPWRRRGLGLSLLQHAFGAFYRRGIVEIGLSVDAESATGAPRLYARAGMTVARSYIQYLKELRPGERLPYNS